MAGDTDGVDHREEWQETLVGWTTGKNGRIHWWGGLMCSERLGMN